MKGGKGNDVFVHTGGKDVITDYAAGADVIKLSDAALKSVKVSGKNVILTTDKGTVTINNGKDKELNLVARISSSALLADSNCLALA